MGNICNQIQADHNPLEKEIPHLEEYEIFEGDPPDQIMKDWLSSNIYVSEDGEEPPKLMKHHQNDKYFYGRWKNGKPEGRGCICQPQVRLFDGNFQDGVPQGKATIKYFASNSEFQGNLKNGQAFGQGVIHNLEQKFKFEGIWQHSRPIKGTMTLFQDKNISTILFEIFPTKGSILYKDQRKYEGGFEGKKIAPGGHGKLQFPPNSKKVSYEGGWTDGQMSGKGKMIWRDGSVYEGNYVDGRKEGEGKFQFPNKKHYYGQWQGGKQNGHGTLFDANGEEIRKGIWENGLYKGPAEEFDNKPEEKKEQLAQKVQQQQKIPDNPEKKEEQKKEELKKEELKKEEPPKSEVKEVEEVANKQEKPAESPLKNEEQEKEKKEEQQKNKQDNKEKQKENPKEEQQNKIASPQK